GDFILLSQMPEPQPGWAQQYNAQMHPAWARKFEPAAITGAESQRVMETLLRLFELTRDSKYLQPLPPALAYFRRSRLENGQLARFYELRTNRPLYFTKDYQMTYSDADLPTHYGFKATSRLDSIAARYQQLATTADSKGKPVELLRHHPTPSMSSKLAAKASQLIAQQDVRGAWVEPAYYRARSRMPKGMPSLRSATFAKNIVTLAEYLAADSRQKVEE
ncbi:MAG: polysaccharide lyase, partial [Pirellulales bacterium]